jgi:hypothetical protein
MTSRSNLFLGKQAGPGYSIFHSYQISKDLVALHLSRKVCNVDARDAAKSI